MEKRGKYLSLNRGQTTSGSGSPIIKLPASFWMNYQMYGGKTSRARRFSILKRISRYAEKTFKLSELLTKIQDRRQYPQITTASVISNSITMFLARMGSLNSFEQLLKSNRKTDSRNLSAPSADSMGRICASVVSDSLREALHSAYTILKRMKALQPPSHGLIALVLDGHESHASKRRTCSSCLKRNLADGTEQFYHRNVTAQLVFKDFAILIDAEIQQPGENELTAAARLYTRVVEQYPRAFDVVLADALYCNEPFFKLVRRSGKDAVVVMKNERLRVYQDAQLYLSQSPLDLIGSTSKVERHCREAQVALDGAQHPLRVIESEERNVNGVTTRWLWLTSLAKPRAGLRAVVELGHSRWTIENSAFNELSTRWHSDHIYKHDPDAILNFWLICMLAQMIFLTFYSRNLKPSAKRNWSMLHVARQIQAELYLRPTIAKPP